MAPPMPSRPLSIEDYFDFEERSPTRHEYVDGDVFAMSDVTRREEEAAYR